MQCKLEKKIVFHKYVNSTRILISIFPVFFCVYMNIRCLWDLMWDLIVSVPDHCLSFYFVYYPGFTMIDTTANRVTSLIQ